MDSSSLSTPPGRTFGYIIHDVARLLRRRFEQRAREAGLPLTRSQCSVLVHVARDEGMSQATLAQLLDIEPITLVRLLDRLQAAGLIERCLDPRDRRVWRLHLTPAAQAVLEDIRRLSLAVREEAFAGLPAAEREALIDRLLHVKANLCGKIRARAREENETAAEDKDPDAALSARS